MYVVIKRINLQSFKFVSRDLTLRNFEFETYYQKSSQKSEILRTQFQIFKYQLPDPQLLTQLNYSE